MIWLWMVCIGLSCGVGIGCFVVLGDFLVCLLSIQVLAGTGGFVVKAAFILVFSENEGSES